MANISTGSATTSTGGSERYPAALAMVTVLFFFWGFVTVLNDILVPDLKSVFDLNYTRVMLIQFAFFAAYFIFSIPSAKVIDAIGYKKTMVAGLLTMGLGAFLFVPAASRLNLTQAFNSLGTTIGPWIGGLLILGAAENKEGITNLSAEALQAF